MRHLNWNEQNERTFYLEVLRRKWKGRKILPYYVKKRTHKKYKRYLNLDVSLFAEKCGKSTNFFVVCPVELYSVANVRLLMKHPYYVDNWGELTFVKSTKWRKMESAYKRCISIIPSNANRLARYKGNIGWGLGAGDLVVDDATTGNRAKAIAKAGVSNFFFVCPVGMFPVKRQGLVRPPYYVDNWCELSLAKLTSFFKDFRMAIFYRPTPSHERELALGGKYVK